jgi:hypothetical protein
MKMGDYTLSYNGVDISKWSQKEADDFMKKYNNYNKNVLDSTLEIVHDYTTHPSPALLALIVRKMEVLDKITDNIDFLAAKEGAVEREEEEEEEINPMDDLKLEKWSKQYGISKHRLVNFYNKNGKTFNGMLSVIGKNEL